MQRRQDLLLLAAGALIGLGVELLGEADPLQQLACQRSHCGGVGLVSSPLMQRSRLLWPEPLLPIMAMTLPGITGRSMP